MTKTILSTIMLATLMLSAITLLTTQNAFAAEADTTIAPEGGLITPEYVTEADGIAAVGDAVVRVYQDSIPWGGENRDRSTLLSLGKVIGTDYFIHPTSDLLGGIPANTDVVIITSTGFGPLLPNVNSAAGQANLDAFVKAGGVLIVDMGDNDQVRSYMAPGSTGSATLVLPTFATCRDFTLTTEMVGPDGLLGTADDHDLVKGPDGIPGTADDWNNSNIDMLLGCFAAHGNLEDGITLPGNAVPIMKMDFSGTDKIVAAEYQLEDGCVIVDTITKE